MWKSTPGYLITWFRYLPSLVTGQLLVVMMLGVIHGATMSYGYSLPEYADTPTNVTYYRGERAILQCSVKNLGTKQIIWKKTSKEHALTVGVMVFVSDPDIGIDHLPHREEWNLIISKVKPKHAGMYECQISTKEDLKRYIQLNVLDKPTPKNDAIKITGEPFVEKGNRINLTCNATGENFPPEDIDWFKDGKKIKQSQNSGINIVKFRVSETKTLHSVLEIEHSDMKDSGVYICRSSDLSITSKSVMVLNGSVSRSRKKISPPGIDRWSDDADTKPIKRDNPDPSKATSTACSLSSSRINLFVYISVLLTLFTSSLRH